MNDTGTESLKAQDSTRPSIAPRGSDVEYRQRLYSTYRQGQSATDHDDRAPRGPYLRRLIRHHVPGRQDVRILDLGCGQGTLVYFLRAAGYRMAEGVDVSPEQVEAARRLGIDGIEQKDAFTKLAESPDGSYDVVFAMDVVEHLRKSELLLFADEIYRVLRSGGRWIAHMPNAGALFGSRSRYADWTHEQSFTPESIAQVLHTAGFDRSMAFEDQPVVHGLASAGRWIAWRIVRAILLGVWLVEKGSVGRECLFSQNMTVVALKA